VLLQTPPESVQLTSHPPYSQRINLERYIEKTEIEGRAGWVDFAIAPGVKHAANMVTTVESNKPVKEFVFSSHCLVKGVATKGAGCTRGISIPEFRAGTPGGSHPIREHAGSVNDLFRNIGAIVANYLTALFLPALDVGISKGISLFGQFL